ncbi:HNH endonuclease family protein [Streptomyces sp. NBC_00887]|uniref:HNH endonuclease family protein n=1 Tax=Streptomyces sp. NBC_00887 TaxID=2975859 RepID=UPI00386BB5FC|nr:HNH endonuclease family protein [Streptomyces sp. NBC_00887]WSY36197.1 HNH endonuclease family protein [Streptomyces sp. NBC_00887]
MNRRRITPVAAALLALSLAGCNPQAADTGDSKPSEAEGSSAASPAPSGAAGGPAEGALSLADAIAKIPAGTEKRDGYERDSFNHWVDEDDDGCETRAEVLLEEATTKPQQGDRCVLTGGVWMSYYDGAEITEARKLDIDHMIPLAEAWDSGAFGWSADRREAFANDLGAERSLVAVTAKTNRSKSDRDPASWLPPAEATHCQYAADWTATKLRWGLNADDKERAALVKLADSCADTTVNYEVAP